jgi:hypothetical protein
MVAAALRFHEFYRGEAYAVGKKTIGNSGRRFSDISISIAAGTRIRAESEHPFGHRNIGEILAGTVRTFSQSSLCIAKQQTVSQSL